MSVWVFLLALYFIVGCVIAIGHTMDPKSQDTGLVRISIECGLIILLWPVGVYLVYMDNRK